MPRPLSINGRLVIPGEALKEQFTRSSGPGGQHVNKTETAVQLRFNLRATDCLSPAQKARAERNLAHRITESGDIIVAAQDSRSREHNREAARDRLAELLAAAIRPVRPRKATRPSARSIRKQKAGKRVQGQKKQLRRKPGRDE